MRDWQFNVFNCRHNETSNTANAAFAVVAAVVAKGKLVILFCECNNPDVFKYFVNV